MNLSSKKALIYLKVGLSSLLASILLASIVYIAVDEALARAQRSSLRGQCFDFLSERARMAMGPELGPDVVAQITLQCRQAIP